MYVMLLLLTAALILSILSINWPVKLYHYYLLNKLAVEFKIDPVNYGRAFSRADPQLQVFYQEREVVIRFMEAAVDSLRSNLGLELRIKRSFSVIMEFYRCPTRQREWGDFRRFCTGNPELDNQWLIITPQPEAALVFWNQSGIKDLIDSGYRIDQVLISDTELVVKLARYGSALAVRQVVERLSRISG